MVPSSHSYFTTAPLCSPPRQISNFSAFNPDFYLLQLHSLLLLYIHLPHVLSNSRLFCSPQKAPKGIAHTLQPLPFQRLNILETTGLKGKTPWILWTLLPYSTLNTSIDIIYLTSMIILRLMQDSNMQEPAYRQYKKKDIYLDQKRYLDHH